MDNNRIDLLSIANRKAFSDVDYQRNCLMDLFEVDRIKPSVQEELKAILRNTYPDYLPAPDSCPVVIRFCADKVPHFEFHLCPKPLPKGCPEYDCDKEVAFYSAKIYNILKKNIDQENAGLESVSVNDVFGTPATADDDENYKEEENEAYQETRIFENNSNFSSSISSNNNFNSSIYSNNLASFHSQFPTSSTGSISNSSRISRSQLAIPRVFPANNIKQELTEETITTFTSYQPRFNTPSVLSPSSKRKRSNITNNFAFERSKQTSRTGVPVCGNATKNSNSIINGNGIYHNSAFQSLVRERFSKSTDDAEVFVHTAVRTMTPSGWRLICPLCDKHYQSDYLKDHINVVHFNKKPFQCMFKDCKFQAGQESYARQHVQNHHKISAKLASKYVEYIEYID